MSTYQASSRFSLEIDAEAANNCSNKKFIVDKLRATFLQAGWAITEVGHFWQITTLSGGQQFQKCTLPGASDVFYEMGFIDGHSEWAVFGDEALSCCTDFASSTSYNVNTGNLNYSVTGRQTNAEANCSANEYEVFFSEGDYDDGEKLHEIVWKVAIAKLIDRDSGVGAFYYGTSIDINGDYVSTFAITGVGCSNYNISAATQVATTITTLNSEGFIAQSQSLNLDDNFIEVYCFLDATAPASSAVANQVRFATRLGSRFAAESTEHAKVTVDNGQGSTTQILGLIATENIQGIIGPHDFYFDQPDGSGLWVHGGVCKLRKLEGEINDPNVKKVIWMSGQRSNTSAGAQRNLTKSLNPAGSGESTTMIWVEATGSGTSTVVNDSGTRLISVAAYHSTLNLFTDNRDGVVWDGGIANVCEPWIGFRVFNAISPVTTEQQYPFIAQIVDAIIPYRSIDISDDATPEVFTFDGELFRYLQTSRFNDYNSQADGPGSSLALRVDTLEIWDGEQFSGEKFYEIKSLELSVNPVASGGSTVLTVTAADSQDLSTGGKVVLHSDNARLDFNPVITFSSGNSTATVTLTENDLGVTETVELVVIGKDSQKTRADLICNA